jgi:hypothetical protein
MNKDDLKQYRMHTQRVKQLTGTEAELYVFTYKQLTDVVKAWKQPAVIISKKKVSLS